MSLYISVQEERYARHFQLEILLICMYMHNNFFETVERKIDKMP